MSLTAMTILAFLFPRSEDKTEKVEA